MSHWGYVALGWIIMYVTIAGWYFTSRMPRTEEEVEKTQSDSQ